MKDIVYNVYNCNFLSDYLQELPSNCLFNKGATGCGGTHLELHLTQRNSLILVPTKELVRNKITDGIFGFYGEISDKALAEYIQSNIPYKKVIGTYDCLPRFMRVVADYDDYFLLVDEYHVLFNNYEFRNKAIVNVLNLYSKFKRFCFMTATPLNEEFILPQLKDLDRITLKWDNAVQVHIKIRDTSYVIKELVSELKKPFTGNYHIFLNSVKTIQSVVKKLNSKDYRVVCSDKAKSEHPKLKTASTKDPVCKYNFYTSYCSEGCDIFDPVGKTIVISDTTQAQTLNDISTTLPQICGRIRDSKYKSEVLFIVHTKNHRYLSDNKNDYEAFMDRQETLGLERIAHLNSCSEKLHESYLIEFTKSSETYHSMYINVYEAEFFSDGTLKLRDRYQFELLTGVYSNAFNILNNLNNLDNFSGEIEQSDEKYSFLKSYLEDKEYTFKELKDTFDVIFKSKGLIWNDRTSIKDYFPECSKKLKKINGKTIQIYKFKV